MKIWMKCAVYAMAANLSFAASTYTVRYLVSDIPNPGGATDPNVIVDPNLVNAWGIAISATSPFWLSNAGTGTATVYSYSATANPQITRTATVVNVPSATGGKGRVTGQIANATGGFAVGNNLVPNFIFCTEDGTLSGWNRTADAGNGIVKVNKAGSAIYKGCAAALTPFGPRLYAANFMGGIDVFDTEWKPVTPGGTFVDPYLPSGLKPFNIQAFGQKLVVTYAKPAADGVNDQAGRGNGAVSVFDIDGNLLQSFSDINMNSPWGVAYAPEFFGDYSYALLVGNFGDGRINAYDALTGAFLGTLNNAAGEPIVLVGLWGLQFGNGRSGGDAKTLYFAAGIAGDSGGKESHGAFGGITTP